ncbi:MAG: hypothetical protein WDA20_13510 [Desulfuromonadales bacterium]|jgi:hypothetical protein
MKTPQSTIFAKASGLEIGPYEKRGSDRPTEGRIALRFFRLEGGTQAIRFVAEPAEGFELYYKINRVFREGGKETLTHRFEASEGEVLTRLSVERYESGGKAGFAFSVQRGEERINVPVAAERFLYAGEFLKHLSLEQAWVEQAAS